MMNEDARLLNEYARTGSPQAFARLVESLAGLVFSAAYRQVRDYHAAEDVTQLAFMALAKKAKSLSRETVPAAWMLVVTRHLARDANKSAARRAARERRAREVTMSSNQPKSPDPWIEIEPMLDAALCSLKPDDRRAVTLRYLQNQSLDEVARVLGVTREAARQRLHRSIAGMRAYFARQGGAAIPLHALGPMICARAVTPPPQQVITAILESALRLDAPLRAAGALSKGVVMAAASKAKLVTAVVLIALAAAGTATVAYRAARPDEQMIATGLRKALPSATAPSVRLRPTVPDGWQAGFEQAYRLRDEQTLKCVAPPYVPQRASFCQAQTNWGNTDLSSANLQLSCDGRLKLANAWFGPMPLREVIHAATRLRSFDFDGLDGIEDLHLPGDWVIRPDIPADQQLPALQGILATQFRKDIRFVPKQVEREVFVASGAFRVRSTPDQATPGFLSLSLRKPNVGPFFAGDLDEFLGDVGEVLGMKCVNEAGGVKGQIRWYKQLARRALRGDAAKRDDLLARLASQTDLTLRVERRPVTIWFVEMGGAGSAQ